MPWPRAGIEKKLHSTAFNVLGAYSSCRVEPFLKSLLCGCHQQAQQAAARTVKLLDNLASSDDAFDAAFLVNHASAAAAFDCVVRVTLPAAADAALATSDAPAWRYHFASRRSALVAVAASNVATCCTCRKGSILASSQPSWP